MDGVAVGAEAGPSGFPLAMEIGLATLGFVAQVISTGSGFVSIDYVAFAVITGLVVS